jgi:hypothetical protein
MKLIAFLTRDLTQALSDQGARPSEKRAQDYVTGRLG